MKKMLNSKRPIVTNPLNLDLNLEDMLKDTVDLDFGNYPIHGLDYENDTWWGNDLSNNPEYLEHKKKVYNKTTIDDILNKKDILLDIINRNIVEYKEFSLEKINNLFNIMESSKENFEHSKLIQIINYCYFIDSMDNVSPEDSKELVNIVKVIDKFMFDNKNKSTLKKFSAKEINK